jgi:transcriptional regulator with XRE-family HTH domain
MMLMQGENKRTGRNLKELREKRGWLQGEAAEKLGISRSHLSTVENGKRGMSLQLIKKIIDVYNVTFEDLHKE